MDCSFLFYWLETEQLLGMANNKWIKPKEKNTRNSKKKQIKTEAEILYGILRTNNQPTMKLSGNIVWTCTTGLFYGLTRMSGYIGVARLYGLARQEIIYGLVIMGED